MQPPQNIWPNTPAAGGTLFFAQAMKAFLDLESFEGFRAYSLDTLARLDEAIVLGGDVLSKRIPATVLSVVFKELAWSINGDAAAKAIAARECAFVVSMDQGSDLTVREKVHFLRLLRLRLYPQYLEELTRQVEKSVNDPQKRVSLFAAMGYLISHLINDGHSREFLIDRLNDRFFSKTIKKVGASVVRSFIQGLAKERSDYKVVHAIDSSIEQFIVNRERWTVESLAGLPAFVQAEISTWPPSSFTKFAVHTVFASDPFKAAILTDRELERFKAFTLIPSHRIPAAWSRESVVHRPRGTKALSLVRVTLPLQAPAPAGLNANFRLKQTVSLFKKMELSFDGPSKERISRALAAAHVATKTTQDEARLLSLWSAFEVLLSEPSSEDIRILHFVKHLLPCICIKYHRRVFGAVNAELHEAYPTEFRNILRGPAFVGQGPTHVRFAKLIVDPQFANERQALLAMCTNNPLALHRVFRLEKFYGTPKKVLSTAKDHADRVRWQLHRIYRVRNGLVHAGESPEYTDTLVSNSLDYLRSCLVNLIRVSARHGQSAELDLVIAEVSLEWSLQLKRLDERGTGPFDDELERTIFGPL